MTERVGLLGWPIAHSRSAAMHNAAFKALGLDWHYDLLGIPPERLSETVTRALEEGFRGFNVTVPHKRAVLELAEVREVEPAVEAIGAANTLIRLPDGGLKATNTDWSGFRDDLNEHGVDVTACTCLILGTGGSARAVEYALSDMGAAGIVFASRHPMRASGQIGYEEIIRLEPSPELIINCTPLGMSPNTDSNPWPENVDYPEGAVIYDLVYNPSVTRLIARAQEAGLQTIGGIGMLVRQGAASFEQWTGKKAPLDVMMKAAELTPS